MDLDTVVAQLSAYSYKHKTTKGKYAGVTAKYLELQKELGRVYDGMLEDPLIKEIVYDVAMETACDWRPAATEPTEASDSGLQTIYCDGCCLGNGREGARAGYGVHAVDASGATVFSEAFRVPAGDPQTNQRAELLALRFALTLATGGGAARYEIRTDSRYAIDCITKWASGWEVSGWRRADNKPVLHADIIKDCCTMYDRAVGRVHLFHVPAHTGGSDSHSRGNAVADRLAKEGAELSLA